MAEQFNLFGESPENDSPLGSKTRKSRILYFDLETQKGSDDVGGWGNIHLMKLAVGVVWDNLEEKYFSYLEKDASDLVKKLRSADWVVGFNVIGFDFTVLQPYADVDLQDIPTFDMLLDVKKRLGFRLSLNHLAHHTLGAEKSADGLLSLQWWKEGKIDQIIEYCIKDVEITRDLYLFGQDNGYIEYTDRGKGLKRLEVDWNLGKIEPEK